MYNLLRSLYQPLVRAMSRYALLFAVCLVLVGCEGNTIKSL